MILTIDQQIAQFKIRSRKKVGVLSREIAESIQRGKSTRDQVLLGKELIRLSRSLSTSTIDWADWEKLKFIDYWTKKAGLKEFSPSLDNPLYEIIQVVDGDSGGTTDTTNLATKTELNAVDFDSKQRDASLDSRVDTLEAAASSAPPVGFYDEVAYKTELHSHLNQAILDQLTQDMITDIANAKTHVGNLGIHVTKLEKDYWNKKVETTDARLSDARNPLAHVHPIIQVDGLGSEIARLDGRIDTIPAGEDGITPNLKPGTVSDGDIASVSIDSTDPANPVISFVLRAGTPGKDGENFTIDAQGLDSGRLSTTYETADATFHYLATDEGKIYTRIPAYPATTVEGWDLGIPFIYSGWTPILGTYEVNAETVVLELLGFTGGSGDAPVIPVPDGVDPATVRWFLGSMGYTYEVTEAKNVKGAKGDKGEDAIQELVSNGDGTKYLGDNGKYAEILAKTGDSDAFGFWGASVAKVSTMLNLLKTNFSKYLPLKEGGTILSNLGLGKENPTYGLHQLGGSFKLEALTDPVAPIVATVGAKGTPAVAEVASLTVTGICTAASNVTVTLDGVAFTVALATTDNTTDLVAGKIRAASYSGWTTGGTLSEVTFTKNIAGSATDATYSAGTTGATGTMTTTTQGKDDTRTVYNYFVVAEDRNGFKTLVSPVGSVADGNPVLDATNYNTISWAAITAAAKYHVLKTDTGTKLGETTETSLNDTGQVTSAFVAPVRNETADLMVEGHLEYITPPNPAVATANTVMHKGWIESVLNESKHVFVVDAVNGDNTTAKPGTSLPYKTIVAASDAATTIAKSSDRAYVYVKKGVYKEANIIRRNANYFFEDGAVVWVDGSMGSIVSDVYMSNYEYINIYGQGCFYHANSASNFAREAICLRKRTHFNIELKEASGIRVNESYVKIIGGSLIYHIDFASSGTERRGILEFFKTTFKSGLTNTNHYVADGAKLRTFDCEFIVPTMAEFDNLKYLKDGDGAAIATYTGTWLTAPYAPVDTSLLTLQQVIDDYGPLHGSYRVAALAYSENPNGWGDNYDGYEFTNVNPTIRIRKDNAIGIQIFRRFNNPGSKISIIGEIRIFDETATKSAIAIAEGTLSGLTAGFDYYIGNGETNCTRIKAIPVVGIDLPKIINDSSEREWVKSFVANGFEPAFATLADSKLSSNVALKNILASFLKGVEAKTDVAAEVPLKVQNTNASRTADLQQWQDSSGNVIAKVDVNGNMTSAGQLVVKTNDVRLSDKRAPTDQSVGLTQVAPSFMVGIDEIPATEKTKLDTATNWDLNGTYIGTPLVNCLQGMEYYTADGKYYIRMAQDNSPRRMIIG